MIHVEEMRFLKNLLSRRAPSESNISRALRAVAESDTPATRHELHAALARQRLVLPVPKVPENLGTDAMGRLVESARIQFLSFQHPTGTKFMAVFTNPDALRKWKPDAPAWIAVDTPSICRLAVASDHRALRINPGDPISVELTAGEIRTLAEKQAG